MNVCLNTHFQAVSKYALCFFVCLHMACVTKRPLQCDPSDYVTVLLHPRPLLTSFFLRKEDSSHVSEVKERNWNETGAKCYEVMKMRHRHRNPA